MLVLVLCGLAGAVGYLVHDDLRLRQIAYDNQALQGTVENQQGALRDQRKQIQHFAKDINRLQETLAGLQRFEKKVRIIANLETGTEGEGVFGIGGSLPEDIDPGLELEEHHNGLVREMHQQVDHLEHAATVQGERFESLIDTMKGQVNLLAATPAIRPTGGWITSGFGYRSSPFTGLKEFHKGIDIANRKGTPVIATGDGLVAFAGRKGFLGNMLVIDHGHGMVTRYAHLSKISVKRGAKVHRGDTVGAIGASGRSTGPHLHYEVLLNGVPVNPKKYILN